MAKYLLITLISFQLLTSLDAKAITLEEALNVAVKNNPEIQLEKSRLEQVRATKGKVISQFLPDVSASYKKGKRKNDAVKQDRGDLDEVSDYDLKQLEFDQPLFSGFSSYNNIKEINFNIKAAQEYYKSKESEILLKSIESYLGLYRAKSLLKLKESDKAHTARLVRLVKQRNRQGQLGGSEVIKYQTFLSGSMSEILTAQKDLFKAEEQYAKVIGVIHDNLILPLVIKSHLPGNKDDVISLATSNNPNIKTDYFKVKSARSAIKKQKGKFSPELSVIGSISRQENVTYLGDRDLKSRSIYLNVKVPLFQKGNEYYDVKKANADLNFALKSFKASKESVINDIKQTYKEYVFYEDFLKSHENLIKLTRSRIAKIEQQVKYGNGDIIDLLESKLELSKILIQKLNSESDYILSYSKLLALTGKFTK